MERIGAKNRDAAGIPTAKQRVAYGQVPCRHSGCENLVRADRVFCPEHRASSEARSHFQEPPSLSAEERRREDFRLGFVDTQIVHTPGLDPEADDPEFVWKDKFDTAPPSVLYPSANPAAHAWSAPDPASITVEQQVRDEEALERRRRFHDFQRRTQRGEYDALLPDVVNSVLLDAAEKIEYRRELGSLRYAIARTIAEEIDPHKMGLTIARSVNAISRLTLTRLATEQAKAALTDTQSTAIVHQLWQSQPHDNLPEALSGPLPDELADEASSVSSWEESSRVQQPT